MICAACRTRIDTSRSWVRVEKGARLPDGTTVPADRNLCSATCLATLYGADS